MIYALSPLKMLNLRNNERCVRKFVYKDGVLFCSCYIENKCYLSLNVILKTGEFSELFSCINLHDFYDELSIVLRVCSELLLSGSK